MCTPWTHRDFELDCFTVSRSSAGGARDALWTGANEDASVVGHRIDVPALSKTYAMDKPFHSCVLQ